MAIAFYGDYVAALRDLVSALDRSPEEFQTYDLRLELAAAGALVVYETKRRKGLVDSLFYGRPLGAEANQRMSQAAAFAAIDRFLGLGQFLALTGDNAEAIDAGYPHCAVNISYRKKGQPKAQSMLMVFIGFNDDQDAQAYAQSHAERTTLVEIRPFRGKKAYEWR
ncbi:hypothetical protein BJF93_09660 [Xaviernesmea oryzae]|uniref:Uncharacterized protein n=1 Tax=Xaviernesmea oryzae TaxID=464029 RepID=A0A1Q9AWP5_9HYPH|nr:hypothetical protein [Xaviernesmea oryzae]OLP59866.1 hypothetical protein BJF93_09660 [Xaviernesmea oryzae]SEK48113.1 hypothetical protein SAMN04487976_102283 [Xaviernesmea oryzae]